MEAHVVYIESLLVYSFITNHLWPRKDLKLTIISYPVLDIFKYFFFKLTK